LSSSVSLAASSSASLCSPATFFVDSFLATYFSYLSFYVAFTANAFSSSFTFAFTYAYVFSTASTFHFSLASSNFIFFSTTSSSLF
jgi:hypothetical protein